MRQILTFFSKLITLVLGENSFKDRIATDIFKEINFEGTWDELEAKKLFLDTSTGKISEKIFSFHVK